jgi:hypothetical protein
MKKLRKTVKILSQDSNRLLSKCRSCNLPSWTIEESRLDTRQKKIDLFYSSEPMGATVPPPQRTRRGGAWLWLLPPSVQVKNVWNYNSSRLRRLHGVVLTTYLSTISGAARTDTQNFRKWAQHFYWLISPLCATIRSRTFRLLGCCRET